MRNLYGFVGLALALTTALASSTSHAQCPAGVDESTVRPISGYFPQDPVTVLVNGQPLTYQSVAPFMINGRVFVEMAALYNALGLAITFEPSPAYKLTGTKDDLKVITCLGTRTAYKTIYGLDAGTISMSAAAFIAQEYNKTLVPAAFIADAAGAQVNYNSTTRTVTITSGRTYFFDWNGSSGTYIQYSDSRYLGPEGGTYSCATGSTFDIKTKYCVLNGTTTAVGPFPTLYRTRCQQLGYTNCATNNWPTDQLLRIIDTAGLTSQTQAEVVALMKSNPEVYGVPYENNDIVSSGLYSLTGSALADFQRSENPMPPFVLSGRRQTDSLVRTLYLMLPSSVRTTYAFLHPDRVAQTPDAYLPYIQKKRKAYVVGSFMGLGGISTTSDPKYRAVLLRHERELFKLRTTLSLLNAMGIQVEGVLYSLGDTTDNNSLIQSIKTELQQRYDRILTAAGLTPQPISFGGDELMPVAFARALGVQYPVYVRISNPNMQHRYDGLRTTRVLFNQKLPEVGLTETTTRGTAAFEVHVLTREPQIGTKIASGSARCDGGTYGIDDWLYYGDSTTGGFRCSVDRTNQASHDSSFMSYFNTYTAADRQRSFIIDARTHNGSWNNTSAPTQCDYLGYSGWGTGANNIGASLAIAKILHYSNNRGGSPVAKRLFLEAVAHDVYANGYQDAQRGQLKTDLASIYGITFNHHPGYTKANDVYNVFNYLTDFASNKMKTHYNGTSCIPTTYASPFKFTAQFWRTFESEVHLWPVGAGEIFTPGVYRTGTVPGATQPMWQVLDPLGRGTAGTTRVDMSYLLAE
ncbi:MAG TPA: stalk domain-containing protein [Archangium sp.]|uniref:stalk domain-containing protein n=1 Tax=Archangium sp. TaxID=1872627 RepID=UPI002E34E07E|nr:stalk domain-containing protein [Archangium sp.]HEX5748565.1 stalk domain-containing protein [Archangium sp.]